MQETKDELDSDNLDKYSLKESSDQDQFKKIQSAFKATRTYRLHSNGT